MNGSLTKAAFLAVLCLAAAPGARAENSIEEELGSLESEAYDPGPGVSSFEEAGVRSQMGSVRSILGGAGQANLSASQQKKLARIMRLLGRVQRLSMKRATVPRFRRMARILMRIQRIAVRMAAEQVHTGDVAFVSDRRGASPAPVSGEGPLSSSEGASSGVAR